MFRFGVLPNFRMPRITQRTVLHAVILTSLLLFLCTTILLGIFVTKINNEHHTVIPPFLLSSAVAGDNMYYIGNQSISSLYNMCVIVRTHPLEVNLLPTTLVTLTQQTYLLSTQHDDDLLTLSIFVVNTDPKNYGISGFMIDAANDANRRIGYDAVKVLESSTPVENLADRVLDMLLLKNDPQCTHFMFANGGDYYGKYFLEEDILPAMRTGKQLIAWDFITRYLRPGENESNYIKAQIKQKYITLSAVLVKREAIINKEEGGSRMHHKHFLPNGIQWKEYMVVENPVKQMARDYFFFKEIYDHVGKEGVEVIHQISCTNC